MHKLLLFLLALQLAAILGESKKTCAKNGELCTLDMDCCTEYCDEGAQGLTEGFGLCREWPFPNCTRNNEACTSNDACCDAYCYTPPGESFSYCTRPPTPPPPPGTVPDYCRRYADLFSCPGPCPCP